MRYEYWQILERFENFLQREMWIGDDDGVRFEMNFPLKKSEWVGTTSVIGSSGSGKTYHVVSMIQRYFKAALIHARRQVVWLSRIKAGQDAFKIARQRPVQALVPRH